MARAVQDAIVDSDVGNPDELTDILVHELLGLGPIEYYLDDPTVSEIHVNGYDRVFLRKEDALERAPLTWASMATLAGAAARMVKNADLSDPNGGSVRLSDGTRIEIVLPPASTGGPVLSIKKPLQRSASAADLVSQGCLSENMATVLRVALENRGGILISSTRAEDATRFLDALLGDVAESRRIVAVETVPSLQLQQSNVVRLETVPGSVPSTLQRAVTLSPDVLAVDPFGGAMVVGWLLDVAPSPSAFVGTFGGRNPEDALSRLVVMGLQGEAGDASSVRSQIADSLDLLVQIGRYKEQMVVRHINDVAGQENGQMAQQNVFQSRTGPGGLEFNASGHVPRLFSSLMESGVGFDTSIFNT
jgi:pilus assembly protein CpaF